MNNQIMIYELSKLFKKNKRSIIISMFVFALLIFGGVSALNYLSDSTKNEDSLPSFQNNENNPGIFRMYVEQEDGTIYINSMIIEEYMLLPEVLKQAESETGVEITDVLLEEIQENFVKTQYDRGALGLSRNGSTHIFTFTTNVGTEEENLKVAEFYYNYILSENINMLDNKLVYIVSEPEIYNPESFAASDIQIDVQKDNGSSSIMSILMTIIGSLLASLILAILFVTVKQLLNKKINYAFSYGVADTDRLVLVDSNDTKNVLRLIKNSRQKQLLLISEFDIPLELKNEIENIPGVLVVHHVDELDVDYDISLPYLFVESGKTNKKWYREQFKKLHLYTDMLTVIHYE